MSSHEGLEPQKHQIKSVERNSIFDRPLSRRSVISGIGVTVASLAAGGFIGCGGDDDTSIIETLTPEPTATNTLEPTPTEIPATPTPEKPKFAADSLRELASSKGISIGTEMSSRLITNKEVRTLLTNQFNAALLALNMGRRDEFARTFPGIRPSRENFDFRNVDTLLSNARDNQMGIKGHHLLWGNPTFIPEWLYNGNFSKTELTDIVTKHIEGVTSYVREKVRETPVTWSVMNEFFQSPGNFWYANFGEDVVDLGFQTARASDPKAKLMLNNGIGNEVIGAVSNSDYVRVKRLKDKGLIDVYGLQAHLNAEALPNIDSFKQNIKRFQELGVEVHVTEFDVNMSKVAGTKEEKDARQAQIYKTYLAAYLESGGKDFTVFGMGDTFSWLGQAATPTMFDTQNKPKPAFTAVQETLVNYQG